MHLFAGDALRQEPQSLDKREVVKMNGLRIYINALRSETVSGDPVFYSRRADGPYYRWCYEEKLAKWHGSRVPGSLPSRELCVATWKGVPAELKASLSEHYLE